MKVVAPSAERARDLLLGAGFVEVRRRAFESNEIFDTDQAALRGARSLLRVRVFDGETIVTFKGPPVAGRHKSREEIETRVESAGQFTAILVRLGYRTRFRYEKYRTTFAREGEAGVIVLDETPIGVFLELEGPPAWIDKTAQALGISAAEYITESYASLYRKHCAAQGVEPSDMVFPGQKP